MPKNCLSQTVGQFRKLQKCAVFPTPITFQTCSKSKADFRLRNTLLITYNITKWLSKYKSYQIKREYTLYDDDYTKDFMELYVESGGEKRTVASGRHVSTYRTGNMIYCLVYPQSSSNTRGGQSTLKPPIFCQIVCRGVQSATPPLQVSGLRDSKLCLKCKKSLEIKRFFLYQLYC